MQYTLELFGGKEFIITQEEFEVLAKATGNILISRLGLLVNPSSISCISPREISLKKVDRQKQQVGVTPSGDIVEKRYGVWYYAKTNNPEQYDDEGRCIMRYYDMPLLPTPEEYESLFKDIDEEKWRELLTDSNEYQQYAIDSRTSTLKLTRIGDEPVKEIASRNSWCPKHQCEMSDCEYIHNGITYP